jgi:hypothetical protein
MGMSVSTMTQLWRMSAAALEDRLGIITPIDPR